MGWTSSEYENIVKVRIKVREEAHRAYQLGPEGPFEGTVLALYSVLSIFDAEMLKFPVKFVKAFLLIEDIKASHAESKMPAARDVGSLPQYG